MLLRFLPWRFLIKKAARSYGIIDPATVIARLRQFSQPSEVQEPIELVRAGIIFQARGLLNTRAIQFNLDWIWPYWVECQFNPADPSFIPRAFSATHINLTHRNWTAIGLPELPLYPLVDPRGLFTPLYDGWSIDFWIVPEQGEPLFPSKLKTVEQRYEFEPNLAVRTISEKGALRLETLIDMVSEEKGPEARVQIKARSDQPARLCVSFRPYNPEGVQFIEKIGHDLHGNRWWVDDTTDVEFNPPPEKMFLSDYQGGDVVHRLDEHLPSREVHCRVGLATGVASYTLAPHGETRVELRVPLARELKREFPEAASGSIPWTAALAGLATLQLPDRRIVYIYDCAVRTLLLLSAYDIFPGPFGYRRFWFRDACLMLNGLLGLGLTERAKHIIDRFPSRQTRKGYFHSQDGEWDSNGQVLWIMSRFQMLTGEDLPKTWLDSAVKGAGWIVGKRMKNNGSELLEGLLPAGFSAEHLGPNDYYYWDDFWGVAGLRAAARLAASAGRTSLSHKLLTEADDFLKAVFHSIWAIPEKRRKGAIPAAPGRRMDAGAIGSMVVDWPLMISRPDDEMVKQTFNFLLDNCFHRGGFFQDMIHSGINIYLTLALAQTLLRFGDARYQDLMETCADLASPTGQWPEAVHPFSGGGCMGDGQHGWAAAEWVLMIRSLFVREEEGLLIIGSGVLPQWLASETPLGFGPTHTPYGQISVRLTPLGDQLELQLDAKWRGTPPHLEARVRGYQVESLDHHGGPTILQRIDQ